MVYGRCLRPALAGLRPSDRFAVFAVPALIAIAGCNGGVETACVNGVLYVYAGERSGITLAVDREGKPVPCEERHG